MDARRFVFASAWLPYALLAPQIAITFVFFVWPALQALWQSFLVQDAFGTSTEIVWLDNFKALFADPLYLQSFRVTALYSALVAFAGLAIALVLAAAADRVARGALAYRTLLIWPYAVAPAIAAVLFVFLFSNSIGLVAIGLKRLGFEWNHALDPTQALTLVVIAAVWKQISYNFLFFLAALQAIPKSVMEAAALDGAGPIRRFVSIAVPLISPTTFFLAVVNIVYAFFDTFAIIDAATQGGPAKATEILVFKVFNDGFKGLDLGSSAAQSVILMAIVIVLTVVQFRYVEKRVHY